MRKTECFGWNSFPINFEWPTEKDLLQMPKNNSFKLAELKYKPYSGSSAFGAFQIIFSDGASSPVFTAKGESD
jgi:hypothetical protein